MKSGEVLTEKYNALVLKRASGCWDWAGPKLKAGYGTLRFNSRIVLAHRASFEIHFSKIPDKMLVLHRCDNPTCSNPEHLFLGTYKDNSIDCRNKGRNPTAVHPDSYPKGEDHVISKLKEKQVVEIRLRHSHGEKVLDLAKEFGVSWSCIRNITLGTRWKHVPPPPGGFSKKAPSHRYRRPFPRQTPRMRSDERR